LHNNIDRLGAALHTTMLWKCCKMFHLQAIYYYGHVTCH